jgi:hypothetical protein
MSGEAQLQTSRLKHRSSTVKMGQYYHPCIIVMEGGVAVVKAWLSPRKYGSGMKQMEHSYLDDNFVGAFEWLISPQGPHHKGQVVWAGDYGAEEHGHSENLYGLCNDETCASTPKLAEGYPLIVNHSKRCYVDKSEIEGEIHPLPLLTMETAGGGGGDYRGINEQFLGIWARDSISVEKTVPEGYDKVAYEFRE